MQSQLFLFIIILIDYWYATAILSLTDRDCVLPTVICQFQQSANPNATLGCMPPWCNFLENCIVCLPKCPTTQPIHLSQNKFIFWKKGCFPNILPNFCPNLTEKKILTSPVKDCVSFKISGWYNGVFQNRGRCVKNCICVCANRLMELLLKVAIREFEHPKHERKRNLYLAVKLLWILFVFNKQINELYSCKIPQTLSRNASDSLALFCSSRYVVSPHNFCETQLLALQRYVRLHLQILLKLPNIHI